MSNRACSANIDSCAEANLDVQYLMGISQVSPTAFYYWNSTTDPWVGFLLSLASRRGSSTTPTVISISYGSVESQISTAYLHSFNIEALKLAAQGVTIVASSGDDGVNCAAGLCGGSAAVCGYYPTFPASSPYVTAVGATQVKYFYKAWFYTYMKSIRVLSLPVRGPNATTPKWPVKVIRVEILLPAEAFLPATVCLHGRKPRSNSISTRLRDCLLCQGMIESIDSVDHIPVR
jgi:hypothetical protein